MTRFKYRGIPTSAKTLAALRNKISRGFRGFTLVELIVVITILAILATVGFLALSGYTSDANKSAVVGNLRTVEKGLSTNATVTGKFPSPSGAVTVTYSGGTAWYQGTAGKSVMSVIGMGEPPKDPQGNSEFDYSLSANGMEYQVASAYLSAASADRFVTEASAATTDGANVRAPTAAVTGNYNGLFVPVSTGGTNYLVAAPSIVLSNATASNRELKSMSPSFVVDGKPGTPASWSGKVQGLSQTGIVLNVSVPLYSSGGSAFPKTASGISALASAVSAAYSGTSLASVSKIQTFLASPSGMDSAISSAGQNSLGRDMAPAVAAPSVQTPSGCQAVTQSGYSFQPLSHGATTTVTKTVTNGTGSLSATCSDGAVSFGIESLSCATNCLPLNGACVTDTTAPSGGSFTMPASTSSAAVTLSVTCPTDNLSTAGQIQMAYGNAASPTNWTACASSASHTLESTSGTKTVYVRFRDAAGNATPDVTRTTDLSLPLTWTFRSSGTERCCTNWNHTNGTYVISGVTTLQNCLDWTSANEPTNNQISWYGSPYYQCVRCNGTIDFNNSGCSVGYTNYVKQ